MVVLGAVGQIVEKAMGHVKLLITFLVSGMCGSVLSFIVMLYNNDFAVSAGASGAIFGQACIFQHNKYLSSCSFSYN